MSCKEIKKKFDERLNHRLGKSDRTAFDEHVATCADCRQEWQAYAGAWTTLERHTDVEPSFGFVERTLRRLSEPPVARGWSWQPALRWTALAASVVVLGVGVWLGHQRLAAQRRAEIYAGVRHADYLEDFDVIASLDQLNGGNKL